MSGVDAAPLVGEQPPAPAHAGLDLVVDQQQIVLVREPAELGQEARPGRADAALALDRLDQDRRGRGPDRRLDPPEVAERHVVEARHVGAEALEMLLLAAGRDGGERAAVECALEGDDPEALRLAALILKAPRHLDRALERLGAGVAEEHGVGERLRDQALGQLLLVLDAVEVRAVPELLGLRLEGRDQMRVGVAEERDRDPAAEVEIASALAIEQISALAALEADRSALVDRQDGRDGGIRHGGLGG